jgi:hypothetical protein
VGRLALVQLENPRSVVALDYTRVLVLGLGLVDHAAAPLRVGLKRSHRQRYEHRDCHGRERPAA